jgi:hypothetical protein
LIMLLVLVQRVVVSLAHIAVTVVVTAAMATRVNYAAALDDDHMTRQRCLVLHRVLST